MFCQGTNQLITNQLITTLVSMKQPIYKISGFVILFLAFANNLSAQPTCLGNQGALEWLLWEKIDNSRLDYMIHLPTFPNHPDAAEAITTLQSPGIIYPVTIDGNEYESVQYGTDYGSLIRGYLTVPQSGNYTFNVTGDDEVRFFLSTDDTKGNLDLVSFITGWTYRKEYAKAAETNQTSADISLSTGNYYYFEVWQKENGGGDHVEVTWKTPSNSTDWQVIPSENAYGYTCGNDCLPSGTACDDGDATTINDLEDGFCNCSGIPTTLPACVGERGEVKALYYLDLEGNSLSTLLDADKYPLMPDTTETLDGLYGPFRSRDNYGTKVSGFLKVPVSGNYEFNITASDRATFALSTTDSPDDLMEVTITNWSNIYEHDDHIEQEAAPVTLDKDNFYYFEVHHKDGTGSNYYNVFWRTPFTQDTLWRFIDKNYLYGNACELACIPEGTLCDDGNNFTNNDQYDADCNCIGTPCRDCEETPVLDYTPTAACGISEKMDNTAVDAWESCTPKVNPNTDRGTSHWIQYDFGQIYLLNESHIWNYNGDGATGKGFKDVVIDYSTDGTTWTQLGGIYEWNQATGVVGYEGFEGPNFNGITARYVLITALNNWDNGLCHGFSKIIFNATACLMMGQSCDDGDANSVNDRYDENCECRGEGVGFSQSVCGVEEMIQGNTALGSNDYKAVNNIRSKGIVNAGTDVQLFAGKSIILEEGFHASAGSEFLAKISVCEETSTLVENAEQLGFNKIAANIEAALSEEATLTSTPNPFSTEDLDKTSLHVWPNPTNSWTALAFNLPKSTIASLCIYATDGKKINCLASNNTFTGGTYTKEFPAQRLAAGMYYVVLKTENEVLTKPLVVIE